MRVPALAQASTPGHVLKHTLAGACRERGCSFGHHAAPSKRLKAPCAPRAQLLEEYSERHEAAVRDAAAAGGPAAGGGTAGGGPGAPQPAPQRRYVLTTMSDAYGGLGNQLPSMVWLGYRKP